MPAAQSQKAPARRQRVARSPALVLPLLVASLSAGCVTDEAVEPGEPPVPRSFASGDLQLHWSFQDRVGSTVLDLSGNGHHGVVHGPTFVSSAWGEALSFDGVDDYVSTIAPRDPAAYGGASQGSMTISARVRVPDADRYNTICFGCGPIAALGVGTSNAGPRAYASLYDEATANNRTWPLSSLGSVNDATWTNVTMVVEAGVGTRYYIDCEFDRFVANTNVALHDFNYSSVGQGTNAISWFQGEIDDLRIWNRSLSAEEIGAGVCEAPVALPCGGAPEAVALGIDLPRGPEPYTVPPCSNPDVTCVTPETIGAEFSPSSSVVVFADGVYGVDDIPGNYLNIEGQTLMAQHVGGAVLEFGVDAGGVNSVGNTYPGSQIRGLVFDIDDPAHAPPPLSVGAPGGRAAIRTSGDATDLEVMDVVIRGNGVLDTGVHLQAADGAVLRRLDIGALRRYGVLAAGSGVVSVPVEVTDVVVHDIIEPAVVADPTAATTGVGLMMAETATLSHIRVRDTRRAGINIFGGSVGTVVDHVDIDRVAVGHALGSVGVYFDNQARDTVLENFCIGPNTRIGVNSEWDHWCDTADENCHELPVDMFPRALGSVVRQGLVESSLIGVHFDQGTVNGHVEGVTMRNYSRGGVVFHNNAVSEAAWPTYDDSASTQAGNTFEEVQTNCQTCDFSHSVWADLTPQCVGQPAC